VGFISFTPLTYMRLGAISGGQKLTLVLYPVSGAQQMFPALLISPLKFSRHTPNILLK